MIQTRWGHLNRGYSLLTRVQAMFLDGHLLLEQTARSRSGRFFNFNGTAGLWRRSCIDEAGGWQHDTLTEDLDLSYRAQLAGWKFIFLPDVITPAELPVDMNGFKSQQHRWTKGFDPNLQEIAPDDLAQQPSAQHQDRGHGAFDLKLRLPSAGLFVRAAPSFDRWAGDWLGSNAPSRRPDFPDRFRFRRRLLYMRAAGAEPAHLDEGNSPPARLAGSWRRSFAQ